MRIRCPDTMKIGSHSYPETCQNVSGTMRPDTKQQPQLVEGVVDDGPGLIKEATAKDLIDDAMHARQAAADAAMKARLGELNPWHPWINR